LQLAAPEIASKVILISSSVPNEGKTTLAVSCAVYAALIGRRALLVDLDFRHPGVSRELQGQAETGVPDALSIDDRSASAVQHFPGLDLDYLPMHSRQDDPLRQFVSGHVPRLLGKLRDSYDCIIVDSPPLLAVAEARLLAAMADKVLLVVKWGSTRREMARDASNLLRDLGLLGENRSGLVGAVLTQVDLKKYAQYRYGYGSSLRATRVLPPRKPRSNHEATSVGVRDAPPLRGLDTHGDRRPPAQALVKRLSIPLPYRSRVAWRLSIGILLCLAIGGTLALASDSLLSLVHRAEQRIVAFGTLDFGAWVKRKTALPATAGSALPAEATAPPAAGEQQTPPRADTASVAATPGHRAEEESVPPASLAAVETRKRFAADPSATKEAAPPQPTPNDVHDTTVTPAPGPAPAQSTSAPSPAAAPSAEAPRPASTAPKPAVALTEPRLSAAEIAALVARGDAFVGVRDIVSARLFYQRAAEAGDGRAALRMGETFDPAFFYRANIRGVSGNQQEALSWYQRARELGEPGAERLLKTFKTQTQ
jgi:Mrp family chromosome partitioning ATPase